MAYQSIHSGGEVDLAISEVQNRIWKPIPNAVVESNWEEHEDTNSSAKYKASIPFRGIVVDESLPPLIWFIDNGGSRYYCDYTSTPSDGNQYVVNIYSNVKKAGTIYAFGFVPVSSSLV